MERSPWEPSSVSGRQSSPRFQGNHSPDSRTSAKAQEPLPSNRSAYDRYSFNLSDDDRTDGSPRSRGYRYPISQGNGLAYDTLLGDRPAHIRSIAKFELESSSQQSLHTHRRHGSKPPRDVEKGGKELDNDEGLNPLATDRKMQTSSAKSLKPQVSRIGGREDVIVTVNDAAATELSGGARRECRWMHIESQDMNFREFKARVMQVFYTSNRQSRWPCRGL